MSVAGVHVVEFGPFTGLQDVVQQILPATDMLYIYNLL